MKESNEPESVKPSVEKSEEPPREAARERPKTAGTWAELIRVRNRNGRVR